jgi:hypothetical protein
MGIIKRQSLKTSIVNYVGVLIGVIFFNFIFPHIISEDYLGLISMFQYLTFMLAALPALSLSGVLFRYYSAWNDDKKVAQFNTFSFILMGIACLFFIMFYLLAKNGIIHIYHVRAKLFTNYYWTLIPLVIMMVYKLSFSS